MARGVPAARTARGQASPERLRLALAAAAVSLATAAVVFIQPGRNVDTFGTGVGEQQMVLLRDGTRMTLNTASRVRVELTTAQRIVTIGGGEALFEVAKDARRPFVVRAGGSEVVAVGTKFAVRIGNGAVGLGDAVDVTLIEGSVTVRPGSDPSRRGLAPVGSISLQPGQRLRIAGAADARGEGSPGSAERLDRPNVDQLLAWKRNEAWFNDTSLADAVGEMNRYSPTPVVVVGPGIPDLRVSGLFRAGDSLGFAHAVAALYGLVVREREGRVEIAPS